MVLPKLINPDPVITASFEVKFSSSRLTNENVLETFYPALAGKFKITENKLQQPVEFNLNNNLVGIATKYLFTNDRFSITVGHDCVNIANVGDYHLWNEFRGMIIEILEHLNSLNIVSKIDRLGIRYVNIFKNRVGILKHLNVNPTFVYSDFIPYIQNVNTSYRRDNIQLVLNLGSEAVAHNPLTDITIKGLYIDIDSSTTGFSGTVFDTDIFSRIDLLHTEAKALFFSVLKKNFLDTLNPQYEH